MDGESLSFWAPLPFYWCRTEGEQERGTIKRFVALTLLFCLCSLSSASDAQTLAKKIHPRSYEDTDGYRVLSSIIEARTAKLKKGTVLIFHQTVSGNTFGEGMSECVSPLSGEFQSALEDFDKKGKTKLLLQHQLSIHEEYKFVETMVGLRTGIYSVSAVGFDENKTRAIVLVRYLVRRPRAVNLGGDKMLYLLRRTGTGWQQAADVPNCGQIY